MPPISPTASTALLNSDLKWGVIILAAGNSSRMGRPKLLLPWGNTTVLGHLIGLWTELAASQIVVVSAAADDGLEAELERLGFPRENRIVNLDPGKGMFSSIQCAARWRGWNKTLTHWAIVLGDQPHLRPTTLRALLDFAQQEPENICQPGRAGHARHPVLLPKAAFKILGGSKDATLKEFLEHLHAEVRLIELDDRGLDLDLDYPADYEKALLLARNK